MSDRPPASLYRFKYFEENGQECEFCDETTVDIHHIDGDPWNNSMDNLLAVCEPHHYAIHRGKDGFEELHNELPRGKQWPGDDSSTGRWNLKGSDQDTIERFRSIKEDHDEPMTNDRMLQHLMDNVPVKKSPMAQKMHESLDTIETALKNNNCSHESRLTAEELDERFDRLYNDLKKDHESIKDSMPSTSRGTQY